MSQALKSSSRPAEEVVEEIRSHLLECKVCFEKFSTQQWGRRPRNLPCGHVICLECVCALSHPVLRQLECPFCRQPCDVGGTYDCRAIIDLQELLGSEAPRSVPRNRDAGRQMCGGDTGTGLMGLRSAFGGWGCVINPTGVAGFGPSGEIVVVHGGHESVTIFSAQGERLRSFGHYGHRPSDLCHPLDVAVTPDGRIVVTDAGDRSVKVFSINGSPQVTVLGPFELPWGVDVDFHGHVLVTDAQAGTLWQVIIDFGRCVVLSKSVVIRGLWCPRAVACCKATRRVAVVDRLRPPGSRDQYGVPMLLKLYSNDFTLLTQVDSFGLTIMKSVMLDISSIAFDRSGHVMATDAERGFVWSLGDLQEAPVLTPLVREGLVRPVGLVVTGQNSLAVLDAGDHAVKMYSTKSDDSPRDKS